MKNIICNLFLVCFLISACAPSTDVIQTAIAETQAVWTPIPTLTPYPTYTPYPTVTLTPSATPTPDTLLIASQIINAFISAGLEAEDPRRMTMDDYGPAPYVCYGTFFLIPSLGPDNGGRLFICNNPMDRDLLANYYQELGTEDALFFSWILIKDNILVQINGNLQETIARQYESAIP